MQKLFLFLGIGMIGGCVAIPMRPLTSMDLLDRHSYPVGNDARWPESVSDQRNRVKLVPAGVGPFYLLRWELLEVNQLALEDGVFSKRISYSIVDGMISEALTELLLKQDISFTYRGENHRVTAVYEEPRSLRFILSDIADRYGKLYIVVKTDDGEFIRLLIIPTHE